MLLYWALSTALVCQGWVVHAMGLGVITGACSTVQLHASTTQSSAHNTLYHGIGVSTLHNSLTPMCRLRS